MNILITTAEWKSALACMRSLAKNGHKISLVSSSRYTPSLYSKFCYEKIAAPHEEEKEKYLNFILKTINSSKYDLILPISDTCIEYFSEIREELRKYTNVVLPSKDAICIGRHKDNTYRFAIENNIPIPKTYFPNNLSELEEISRFISFPCIVKKANGSGGSGNSYIKDRIGLISLLKNLEPKSRWPVIQEFVEGKCYGFSSVCANGKILDFFIHEKVHQYPQTGGITLYGRSCFNEQIYELSSVIINKLLWTGPICFDFFITNRNYCVLLEINPRFSGITQFANYCGVDLPSKLLELTSEKVTISKTKKYKTDIYYQAIFPEGIIYFIRNKRSIPVFLRNLLFKPIRFDFPITDPNLLLHQIAESKWNLLNIKRFKKNLTYEFS